MVHGNMWCVSQGRATITYYYCDTDQISDTFDPDFCALTSIKQELGADDSLNK